MAPTGTDNSAQQRLVALRVGEISLVDHPANEEEFLLVQKATWSGAFVNDLPDNSFLYIEPNGKKDADGKTVPRSLRHFPVKDGDGKVDLPHLRNSLARIPQSDLPQSVKDKAAQEAQRLLEEANKETATRKSLEESMSTAADSTTTDTSTAASTVSSDAQLVEVTKVADELFTELEKAGKGKKPESVGDVMKQIPPELRGKLLEMMGMIRDMMGMAKEKSSEAAVEKGRAQFSAERKATLKDSLSKMLGIMKDVDPEGFSAVLAQFAAKIEEGAGSMLPAAIANGGASSGTTLGTITAKSQEELAQMVKAAVAEAVKPLDEKVTDVAKRVEGVEKAGAITKTAPEGNTAPDKPVAKDKKGLWSGVL
jgi:hypothetical protein